jgi:hypothetical protein
MTEEMRGALHLRLRVKGGFQAVLSRKQSFACRKTCGHVIPRIQVFGIASPEPAL